MMFPNLIGKIMEVYMDDILVKSLRMVDYVSHLENTFRILRKFRMKLNPLKCTFGVASGQFLGYIVNRRKIEANLEKIKALIEIRSLNKPKEVQSLNGLITALRHFILKVTDKSLPFFKILKAGRRFQWAAKCKEVKDVPLSKSKPREPLLLYLAVSREAVSVDLVREEEICQLPVYYIGKALLLIEALYPDMEKLSLSLVTTSRKLRPYFQAHSIELLTNFSLKQVL